MMRINKAGLELIKEFEGLRLRAYQCSGNVWTIGYGHTLGVKEGDNITAEQAEKFLLQDIEKSEDCVRRWATEKKVSLNSNQFSALVSLVYNCGPKPLAGTVGTKLLRGDIEGAAEGFLLWNKAGGRLLAGLLRRREAERKLFLKKDESYGEKEPGLFRVVLGLFKRG